MKFNFFSCQFEEELHHPNKTAVVGSDGNFTWEELKQKTGFFVENILSSNIPVGAPIIIFGHKQRCVLPAILACFITKRPYIPIDPIVPIDRIQKIISSSGSQSCFYFEQTEAVKTLFDCVINENGVLVHGYTSTSNKIFTSQTDPLAYIIFTSGSTGEPKGVQITHGSLQAFADWILTDYQFDESIVVVNRVPFIFDVSVFDYCSALLFGGTLVLTDNATASSAQRFFDNINKYKCNTWVSTPGFAYQYIRHPDFNKKLLPSLNTFYFAGEVLMPNVVEQLWKLFPGCKIVNAYGPTEATVYATKIEITKDIIAEYTSLPIGYPPPFGEVLINVDPSSENNEGEIVIVGDHVSVGYCNNIDLNAEKFAVRNGKRVFKTGDYGYYKNDMIFFLGRKDDQVKLHGYRIELNEISTQILNSKLALEAATIPLRRGGEVKRIVSFIVPQKGEQGVTGLIENIGLYLKSKLPEYMVPSEFVLMEKLPYNNNHKIDKKKLLEDYLGGAV